MGYAEAMASINCIRAAAALAVTAVAAVAAAQPPPEPRPLPASSSFTIFVRAVPIGSEQIAVQTSADGWTITSSGRIGAPLDIVARRVQARYSADWKPLELTVDA